MLKSTLHRYRNSIGLALIWLVFLSFIATYWLLLERSHQKLLVDTEQRAQLRASQAAHALSTQVHAQLLGIDFALEHLVEHWTDHNETVFRKLIDLAQHGVFKDSLDVIAVADAKGRIVFSSHNNTLEQPAKELSIADRDYFQQLAQQDKETFLISAPVLNKATQRWTVQFSHSIVRNGKFIGLIVASVTSKHLSEAFRQVYPGQDDVVLLLLNDGSYLTRTHALEKILNTKVPSEREFLQQPEKVSGHYTVVTPIDGVERIYAWHRTLGFPVVLSLGLNKANVLAPVLLTIKVSKIQNLIGTILLLLAALWITRLVLIETKQNRAILQSKERFITLLNGVALGVLLEDENSTVVALNARLCSLLNLTLNPNSLIGLEHKQLLDKLSYEQASWFSLSSHELTESPSREVLDSSSGGTLKINWVPIRRGRTSLGHVWFVQDISSQKQKEQTLLALATTDPLTGLHNRRSFLDILQQQLGLSRVDLPGALLMLDIDHFKKVNDTFGHPVGDLVIQNVTQVIRETLRQDDFSGRVGGEEFAVLLPKVTLQQAVQLAERIRKNVAASPTVVQTETLYVTVSIGVASLYDNDAEQVQVEADQVLYQAKNSGRNRVCCVEYAAVDAI